MEAHFCDQNKVSCLAKTIIASLAMSTTFPLQEKRTLVRGEMLYENAFKLNTVVRNLQLQIQLISLIYEHVAWAQPSIIEYIKTDI